MPERATQPTPTWKNLVDDFIVGMDDDGNCPVLDEVRYGLAAIRIPAATDWTFATGIEPDARRAGGF